MRALSFAAVVFLAYPVYSFAQERQFPYDAIVQEDGVYVRSGPGENKYYPTTRLSRGDRVSVHRHDPGGWFMIAPPAGSFSWVPKQYVRVTGSGVGEVTEAGVVAYVGTDFGSEANVWQRRLTVNQRVEILGEGRIEITRERGPEPMLKIRPPRREWRWIPGRAIVPADGSGGVQEPIAPPQKTRQGNSGGRTGFLNARPEARRSPPRSSAAEPNRQPQVQTAKFRDHRRRLLELDNRFRAIVLRPTAQWDFTELEQDYLALQREANYPAMENQIKLRLPALARYKKTKRNYDDFVALTSATARRDRELLRLGSGTNPSTPPPATELLPAPPQTTGPGPSSGTDAPSLPRPSVQAPVATGPSWPAPRSGGSVPADSGAADSGQTASVPDPARPAEPPPAGMTRVQPRHPRFAGAGFVQRSGEPDVPEYVLLAPSGKILAYLDAVGDVDLSKHVGYAMGVEGDRFHSPKLKSDFIRVRGVAPIRLK